MENSSEQQKNQSQAQEGQQQQDERGQDEEMHRMDVDEVHPSQEESALHDPPESQEQKPQFSQDSIGGGINSSLQDSAPAQVSQQKSEYTGVPIVMKKEGNPEFKDEAIEAQRRKEREEEERRIKVKANVIKLFNQTKVGCRKSICFNQYCLKNPFAKKRLTYSNDNERLKEVVKYLQSVNDPGQLICSDSVSFNLSTSTEKEQRELLEDAHAFSASFLLPKSEDQEMKDESHVLSLHQSQQLNENQKCLVEYLIDFSSLDEYLKRIDEIYPNSEILKQSLESLIDLFKTEYDSLQTKPFESALFIWRSMLMILQVKHFSEWDWSQLLTKILVIMNQAQKDLRVYHSPEIQNLLVEYLEKCLVNYRMLSVIQKIQSFITLQIISGVFTASNIEKTVRVLDQFNEANNLKRAAERVDYKEFYNDAINKEINLRDHFISWIEERERCQIEHRPFDRLRIFTLCSFPWILDSANKAELLKIDNRVKQSRQQDIIGNPLAFLMQGHAATHLMFEVRRDSILDDALRVISKPGVSYQKPLRVIFQGEPGIDEGGVRKEFFQLLIKSLFDPNYSLFTFNEKNVMYYINGLSHEPNINFELIGLLMGLAIYNNIILDVSFPQAIYKLLLFEEPTFDDLKEWQPEIAQSLEFILNYNDPSMPLEDVLGTNFAVEVENFGEKIDFELKPGGSEIFVNEQNKEEYVQLYIHYTFVKQCEEKLKSFKRGFYKVCDEALMRQLFKPQELEQLICGSRVLDFYAWEKNCRFIEGYTDQSPQAKWLWEIIHDDFNDEQRKKFLAFCTGSDRAPILGLGTVKLYVGRHGEDSEMLPSSHTCFNHLLIPEYQTKEKLKQKLVLAINNAEGFGLM